MKSGAISAGQGSRLGHLTDDRPKCLIDFNGRTLLDRQLDTLAANGIEEAVVVTGFHDDLVDKAIAARTGGPRVRTIFNPFYKVADNTGSLYMAREELSGEKRSALVVRTHLVSGQCFVGRTLGEAGRGSTERDHNSHVGAVDRIVAIRFGELFEQCERRRLVRLRQRRIVARRLPRITTTRIQIRQHATADITLLRRLSLGPRDEPRLPDTPHRRARRGVRRRARV